MGGLYDAATLRALVGVAKKEIRRLAAFATTLLPQRVKAGNRTCVGVAEHPILYPCGDFSPLYIFTNA